MTLYYIIFNVLHMAVLNWCIKHHYCKSMDYIWLLPCNLLHMTSTQCITMGALVCMSRWDMPVCPGDVIICRWSCAEPGSGLFAVHFLPHDVTFSIHRWCQAPPCGGSWRMYTSRSSGQNALKPWLRYCFTLCKYLMSPNSYLCI